MRTNSFLVEQISYFKDGMRQKASWWKKFLDNYVTPGADHSEVIYQR